MAHIPLPQAVEAKEIVPNLPGIILKSCLCQAGDGKARAYLAQHRLFDQIPRLRQDICEPEYCSLGEGRMHAVNAWLGPAGTVSSQSINHFSVGRGPAESLN